MVNQFGNLKGDILFMRMSKDPICIGDILSFTVDARENAASCISDVSEIDESSFVKELHYRQINHYRQEDY
uniref:Uncharacterized protein n=1 Tax=Helianthus annuus TaxID=4232 RepID=A0A251UGR8_HELAN